MSETGRKGFRTFSIFAVVFCVLAGVGAPSLGAVGAVPSSTVAPATIVIWAEMCAFLDTSGAGACYRLVDALSGAAPGQAGQDATLQGDPATISDDGVGDVTPVGRARDLPRAPQDAAIWSSRPLDVESSKP